MKNILVVGGAGYIGSHVVKMLLVSGYNPIVYDNFSKGHRASIAAINSDIVVIEGDLGDKSKLTTVFNNYDITAVMHFAAFIEVNESVINPAIYYDNNIAKVLRLLDAMIECNVMNLIFSSTAAIFGEPKSLLIDENHSQNPINPYGKSKLMVEKILNDYDAAYGLKSCTLRYFNASGADESALIGEAHSPETHLIPLILKAALGKKDSIKIFGNDYETFDGSCIRDFVHVNDLAKAHVLALQKIILENKSDGFNLGNGEGFSVKEVIALAKKVTGVDFKVEVNSRREGDPATLVANSKKAKDILGWSPVYSLESIIKTAWDWENNRKY